MKDKLLLSSMYGRVMSPKCDDESRKATTEVISIKDIDVSNLSDKTDATIVWDTIPEFRETEHVTLIIPHEKHSRFYIEDGMSLEDFENDLFSIIYNWLIIRVRTNALVFMWKNLYSDLVFSPYNISDTTENCLTILHGSNAVFRGFRAYPYNRFRGFDIFCRCDIPETLHPRAFFLLRELYTPYRISQYSKYLELSHEWSIIEYVTEHHDTRYHF